MNKNEFTPEYPGDNPNRKWVRDKAAQKGIRLNYTDLVLRLPNAQITWLFSRIIFREFGEGI